MTPGRTLPECIATSVEGVPKIVLSHTDLFLHLGTGTLEIFVAMARCCLGGTIKKVSIRIVRATNPRYVMAHGIACESRNGTFAHNQLDMSSRDRKWLDTFRIEQCAGQAQRKPRPPSERTE